MSQPDRDQPEQSQPDESRPDNETAYGHDQDREPPTAGAPGESNTWAMPDVNTRDAARDHPVSGSESDSQPPPSA